MARNYIAIIFILFYSCDNSSVNIVDNSSTNCAEYFVERDTVRVDYIYDGDTFDFKKDTCIFTVRILDLDTYETFYGDRLIEQANKNKITTDSALNLGFAAKDYARKNILNKEVIIYQKGSRNRDVYDRLLRKVIINGQSYDSIFKAKGWNTNL